MGASSDSIWVDVESAYCAAVEAFMTDSGGRDLATAFFKSGLICGGLSPADFCQQSNLFKEAPLLEAFRSAFNAALVAYFNEGKTRGLSLSREMFFAGVNLARR